MLFTLLEKMKYYSQLENLHFVLRILKDNKIQDKTSRDGVVLIAKGADLRMGAGVELAQDQPRSCSQSAKATSCKRYHTLDPWGLHKAPTLTETVPLQERGEAQEVVVVGESAGKPLVLGAPF
jgi:hypothetical protein